MPQFNECITFFLTHKVMNALPGHPLKAKHFCQLYLKKKKNVKMYNFFNELVIIKQRVIGVSSKKGWQGFNGL